MKLFLFLFLISFSCFAGSPQMVPKMTHVTIDSTDTVAIAANASRGYLMVQSQSAGNCYVSFGTAAASSSNGVLLTAGQYYEPLVAPKTAVHAICASDTQAFQIVEGNF